MPVWELRLFLPGSIWTETCNWMINIGTIPYNEIHRYIPGSSFRELLRELYDFFTPVSVKYLKISLQKKKKR